MPPSKADTSTQRSSRRGAASWSLDLPKEEEKVPLNLKLPKSLHEDVEMLRDNFDTTAAAIVEKCLRFALESNEDLKRLKVNRANA